MPSHVDIAGNEVADIAAKEATTERELYRLPLNINEYKSIVKKKIYNLWNKDWKKEGINRPCHLYKIKPTLGDWKSSYKDNRREEVVISRLRTCTCRYLVQHHFQKENLTPMNKCDSCKVTNSIEHLILTCPRWRFHRQQIYSHLTKLKLPIDISSILGDQFDHDILFNYLRSTSYYDHI